MRFTASHRGGSGAPLVLVHGFTDTWRTWELVLASLEREHDVLAPTLPGHAGGPPLPAELRPGMLADAVEAAMDEVGFETAHVAGNSLGGHVALQLAERGRARSVTAFAPAGGWAPGDDSWAESLEYFASIRQLIKDAAPHADAIMATPEGRRRATAYTAERYEHIPAELLAHQMRGAAACETVAMTEHARRNGWPVDLAKVRCPVRMVWGTEDRLLRWPGAAARFREGLWHADWVELEGVGHCPQLDVPVPAAQLILEFAAR